MKINGFYENSVNLSGHRPLTRDACSLTRTNTISSRGDKRIKSFEQIEYMYACLERVETNF